MPVAFCLVENKQGQVLLIQRGYGKEKYKWSLPGGNVDGKEGYQRAAARETREEACIKSQDNFHNNGGTHQSHQDFLRCRYRRDT